MTFVARQTLLAKGNSGEQHIIGSYDLDHSHTCGKATITRKDVELWFICEIRDKSQRQ